MALLVSLDEEELRKIEPECDQRRTVNFFARVAKAAFSGSRKQVHVVEFAGPFRFIPTEKMS
jgi:hypothetical protein